MSSSSSSSSSSSEDDETRFLDFLLAKSILFIFSPSNSSPNLNPLFADEFVGNPVLSEAEFSLAELEFSWFKSYSKLYNSN